jgi:hypothetical protein
VSEANCASNVSKKPLTATESTKLIWSRLIESAQGASDLTKLGDA